MNKLINGIVMTLFLTIVISAAIGTLGTFKQGESINLIQTCSDCTYANITSVLYPNSSTILEDVSMTKDGTRFTYTLDGNYTIPIGKYTVNGVGDEGGKTTIFVYDFEITTSGKSGNANIVFIVLLILFICAVGFIGFFGKNIPISILGGGAMIALGVYIINNGLIIYRDWLTNYLSYVIIALGAIFSLVAIVEWLEDIF